MLLFWKFVGALAIFTGWFVGSSVYVASGAFYSVSFFSGVGYEYIYFVLLAVYGLLLLI